VTSKTHPEADLLGAFQRGELPAHEHASIAEHLTDCDTCCLIAGRHRHNTPVDAGSEMNTNPAAAVSDDNFIRPGSFFSAAIPPAFANHPQYRVIEKVGEGGMGVVYKAEHKMMGRTVALKVLAPHLMADAEAVHRFLQEVAAAGKLSHPNIVISHDAGEAGGLHFLVMEFVEGISLDKLVSRRGPLVVNLASHFARQTALGLQHAHDKGMVHRDVKPPNMMVTRKGQVKILDFGLARLGQQPERKSMATAPNLIMGTPDFLSPEQAKNSHDVDIRSDLYSLGCTLYYLLTGCTPFSTATTFLDKLLAHTESDPEPINSYRQDVPDGLIAVIAKLMAKRPADRYSTPAEAAAALAPFAKNQEPPASPGGTQQASTGYEVIEAELAKPAEPRAETEAVRRKPRKKKRRRSFLERRSKVLAAIAGVMFLGLIAGAIVRSNGKATHSEKPRETASVKPSTSAPAAKFEPNVLIVLPSNDVSMEQYQPLRQRLEQSGARVFTASGPYRAKQDLPFKVDYTLHPELDVSGFSALVFIGRDAREFAMPGSGGAFAARRAIDRFRSQNGVVAAFCEGEGVLAANGVLNGKQVAAHPGIRNAPEVRNLAILWQDKNVIADGKVITGSAPEHAAAFADAIVKVLRSE